MRQASPVFHADKVKVPVFIAQSPEDPRVNSSEVVQFVKELKKRNVDITYFEKSDDTFPIKNDEGRERLYLALAEFLDSNLKKR
jgi:dipeptidyl aminopeptidase/acylaminoacyl peptidase